LQRHDWDLRLAEQDKEMRVMSWAILAIGLIVMMGVLLGYYLFVYTNGEGF
jgi:hypothetical protein